jgi:hypothetical protein
MLEMAFKLAGEPTVMYCLQIELSSCAFAMENYEAIK